jgi:hypothetical protein
MTDDILLHMTKTQSGPVPQEQRDACIEIMDRVMKRPCSALFREPVNSDHDGAPNYYAVVKRLIDLGTMRRRLIDDEYQSMPVLKNYRWRIFFSMRYTADRVSCEVAEL